jgi:uncharacterized spore protein YtfJ
MAENKFSATAEALFKGMNGFVNTKTVVGEPQQIGDAIIIPLVDISCGMAAGSFVGGKDNGAGGMNTKMSPSAVLILQNGVTKLVTVKNQDAVSKVLDMVPEVINHFSAESKISPEAKSAAKKMVEKSE